MRSKDHRRYLFGTVSGQRLAEDELPPWCLPKQQIFICYYVISMNTP